ncbi:hypothetical protein CRENBAI_004565 [Crenichthys baileyi]|uniref:Uncharacterized protein n=1 Tax=Crenichthys baileyi TaxID=28760 RepID=A0AAV9SDK4_9TELE
MNSTLLQAVNRRFSSIGSEPLYAVSTSVDDRYKDRFFTSGETEPARLAKGLLTEELEKMEQALFRASADGATQTEPAEKNHLHGSWYKHWLSSKHKELQLQQSVQQNSGGA